MKMIVMLGEVGSGRGMVYQLLILLLVLIAVALIWAAGRWIGTKFAVPAQALTGWDILFVLVGLILAVNLLMTLAAGHGFIPNLF